LKTQGKRKALTKVYEPLTLNYLVILTKLGKPEVKDFAAAFSSVLPNFSVN
jgi:hypothetical protein